MLKKIGISVGSLLPAAFAPAFAADLPVRTAAPAPIFTVAPFSWNGFYVGVNAGLITASTTLTGYNPGGVDGYCWSDDCSYNTEKSRTGGIFGAQIGYNFQTGNLVLGVEADIGWSSATKSHRAAFTDDYTYGKTGVGAIGTARLRLGYSFDRALVYLTGGLAYGKVEKVGDSYAFQDGGSDSRGTLTAGGWKAGWTVGAGVEYAINNNWSVKAEGLYYDLGAKSGVSTAPGDGYTWTSGVRSKTDGVIARLGLNYRFGGTSAPVVARY